MARWLFSRTLAWGCAIAYLVLLFWGIVAAVLSVVPALLIGYAPPVIGDGFVGLVAILLTFSVTPIAVLAASVGAILLLVAVLRRDRF